MLFLAGFLAASLVWSLGWSEGGTLLDAAADAPGRTHALAAALLLATTLVLALLPRLLDGVRSTTPLLVGATLGLAACSLGMPLAAGSGSGPGPWILLALGLVPLAQRVSPGPVPGPVERPSARTLLPFLCAAIPSGVLLATAFRLLSRFLPADGADQGAMITTALLLASLGSFGFAPRGTSKEATSVRACLRSLTWMPVAAALSLRALTQVTRPTGLRSFTAQLGLDPSDAGTLWFDVALAAMVLGPLSLAIGATTSRARAPRSFLALFGGLGIGLALSPLLVPGLPTEGPAVLTGSQKVLGAAALAAAVLPLWGRAGGPSLTLGALGAAAALYFAPTALPIPRAWVRFPKNPSLVRELPEGQVWVQAPPPGASAPSVWLDQRAITPGVERLALEQRILEVSLQDSPARVLLVGHLTPSRAQVMLAAGVRQCDRTGSWWRLMPELEGQAQPSDLEGEVLSPGEAWERAVEGVYDLVLVLPVEGRATPLAPSTQLPPDCATLCWAYASSHASRMHLGDEVVLVADGLRGAAIGWGSGATGPRAWAAGQPRRRPLGLERLLEKPARWEPRQRELLLERLSEGAEPARARLARALGALHGAQGAQNPLEAWQDALVLEDDGARELAAAASELPTDPLAREVLFGLAEVLTVKRRVPLVFELLEPISEPWGRPVELEVALANAEIESLEAAAALERLSKLAADHPLVVATRARAQQALEASHRLDGR